MKNMSEARKNRMIEGKKGSLRDTRDLLITAIFGLVIICFFLFFMVSIAFGFIPNASLCDDCGSTFSFFVFFCLTVISLLVCFIIYYAIRFKKQKTEIRDLIRDSE